eukprot:SAG11_NODE_8006_length_1071_cov_0.992798_1_plen_232_part_00
MRFTRWSESGILSWMQSCRQCTLASPFIDDHDEYQMEYASGICVATSRSRNTTMQLVLVRCRLTGCVQLAGRRASGPRRSRGTASRPFVSESTSAACIPPKSTHGAPSRRPPPHRLRRRWPQLRPSVPSISFTPACISTVTALKSRPGTQPALPSPSSRQGTLPRSSRPPFARLARTSMGGDTQVPLRVRTLLLNHHRHHTQPTRADRRTGGRYFSAHETLLTVAASRLRY